MVKGGADDYSLFYSILGGHNALDPHGVQEGHQQGIQFRGREMAIGKSKRCEMVVIVSQSNHNRRI
jgi:hypothetical protein